MTARYYPWVKLLPTPVVLNMATLGPMGHLGKAPGTTGTVLGLLGYTVFFHGLGPIGFVLLLALWIYVAVAICDEAEVRMARRDPGCIILDEFVAVPLCFIGLQPAMLQMPPWILALAAFALFRVFDIIKPFGIRRLQNWPGGVGVVADDLAAALATALVLNIGVMIWMAVG